MYVYYGRESKHNTTDRQVEKKKNNEYKIVTGQEYVGFQQKRNVVVHMFGRENIGVYDLRVLLEFD